MVNLSQHYKIKCKHKILTRLRSNSRIKTHNLGPRCKHHRKDSNYRRCHQLELLGAAAVLAKRGDLTATQNQNGSMQLVITPEWSRTGKLTRT